jgi:hypothetical protein
MPHKLETSALLLELNAAIPTCAYLIFGELADACPQSPQMNEPINKVTRGDAVRDEA